MQPFVVVRGAGVGEHVRVAADELRDEVAGHVVDVERVVAVLLRDPRVEDHLQQQVAQLLPHAGAVVGLDRLGQLVRLLQRVRHQGGMGLPGVPGAAARGPQPVHDGDELEQRGAGRRRHRRAVAAGHPGGRHAAPGARRRGVTASAPPWAAASHRRPHPAS